MFAKPLGAADGDGVVSEPGFTNTDASASTQPSGRVQVHVVLVAHHPLLHQE
jgi:hypothetical protein